MSVSRREFLIAVPAAGAVLALAPLDRGGPESPSGSEVLRMAGASNSPGAPVVSFHLDQPYLDATGLEKPYVPPVGMRSGASLAALSEEEVLSRFYGFI
jgi:hypothetical protein